MSLNTAAGEFMESVVHDDHLNPYLIIKSTSPKDLAIRKQEKLARQSLSKNL